MIEVYQKPTPQGLHALAAVALEMIRDGDVVGLGTGHAATAFVEALGGRVREGLRVRGVPTSRNTAAFALQCGIPTVSLDDVEAIDVTIDGADEVDPHLDLIKGLGGALVREKIVASVSCRLVIVVGAEKLVSVLGEHGVLPVEVVPFGLGPCRRRLADLGLRSEPREVDGKLLVTDNGNYVLDCQLAAPPDPIDLEQLLRAIPGVVGTGLFLGMADTVLAQDGDRVEVRHRQSC
jgi:ribose 5-phosphate isomerase A